MRLILATALTVISTSTVAQTFLVSPKPPQNLPDMEVTGQGSLPLVIGTNSGGAACRSSEVEKQGHGICAQSLDHHLEIRDAKRFLPEIEGLKPERLTIRKNVVTFHYSF